MGREERRRNTVGEPFFYRELTGHADASTAVSFSHSTGSIQVRFAIRRGCHRVPLFFRCHACVRICVDTRARARARLTRKRENVKRRLPYAYLYRDRSIDRMARRDATRNVATRHGAVVRLLDIRTYARFSAQYRRNLWTSEGRNTRSEVIILYYIIPDNEYEGIYRWMYRAF